ncbi:MAG: hypothetical protein LIV11_00655 [Bacillota bacterium]|nr:hypothetical protein [Bacillota bacterium]
MTSGGLRSIIGKYRILFLPGYRGQKQEKILKTDGIQLNNEQKYASGRCGDRSLKVNFQTLIDGSNRQASLSA